MHRIDVNDPDGKLIFRKQIENNASPRKRSSSSLKIDTSSIGKADETLSPTHRKRKHFIFEPGDFKESSSAK